MGAQGSKFVCVSATPAMTTTTTKTTIAKTTVTKTKKPPSKRTLQIKRVQVKKNRKAAAKKKGIGLFAPVNLSASLAAICGGKKMPRTEAIKKLWVYIKKNSLNAGRIITPDAKLKAVLPVAKVDMLKMAGMVSKHMSK